MTKELVCGCAEAKAATRAMSPAGGIDGDGNRGSVVVGCKSILEFDATTLWADELQAVPSSAIRVGTADSARGDNRAARRTMLRQRRFPWRLIASGVPLKEPANKSKE